jgi:hypothetical protein|nr:MAG TPA: hypothetical protein [Bacteriophage sp.]
MNELKEVINSYINNLMTLKIFEDRIVSLMETQDNELLDDILEDIAYTTTGEIDKKLLSEEQLKEKLREYLRKI